MASLYVTEYATLGAGQVVAESPPVAIQKVSYTGTAGTSSAFNARTRYIRVHTDGICSFAIGTSITATTSYPRMAADQTEYFAVTPGHTISAITNS